MDCRVNYQDGNKCRDHPDAEVVEDYRTCERICSMCGLILNRIVTNEAEWRNSTRSGSAGVSRVGAPINPMLVCSDLGTTTARDEEDFSSKGIEAGGIKGADNDIIFGVSLIEKLSETLAVSKNISNRALNIFKEMHQKNDKLRKPMKNALAAAALYVACRETGTFILYKQFCNQDRTRNLDVGRHSRIICKTLGISLPPATAEDYIPAFCNILEVDEGIKEAAVKVAKAALAWDLVIGRSPVAVAAASIYLVTQAACSDKEGKPSRDKVAQVAEVSPLTLSTVYKLMYAHAEKLFPTDFRFAVPIEELPLK